ncbi:MAG: hypothetical protein ACOH2V_10235 [Candidatus Saccharimonadaceae bacterium]
MKKIKSFLEKWIKFEMYDTDIRGIYQIYSGIAKNSNEVDLSNHGFNLYFGSNKTLIKDYHEYGFNSVEAFKNAVIYSLYYISLLSAEEIVGEHIINSFRDAKPLKENEIHKYIWQGKAKDNPEKWSIYIDLRNLE